MATFESLLKKYVNSSYDELLNLCKANLGELCGILGKYFGQEQTSTTLMILFGTCISVDGKLNGLECKFINDLLGANMSSDEIMKLAQSCVNTNAANFIDSIADALPAEEKSVLLSACLCFLAIDETITVDEIKFLEKLIVE
ncbi:MAG: hypothetical protein IJV96_07100 [Clostridia bacterium]|nr:hypothetical protein [Clostridia bacterium]